MRLLADCSYQREMRATTLGVTCQMPNLLVFGHNNCSLDKPEEIHND